MKKISISYLKNVKNGLENLGDSNPFLEYSSNMQDVYKNIGDYSPSRKCNVLSYLMILLLIWFVTKN